MTHDFCNNSILVTTNSSRASVDLSTLDITTFYENTRNLQLPIQHLGVIPKLAQRAPLHSDTVVGHCLAL